MSRPNPPALTVRYDGSTRTFAPGNDVVVGRDLRADVRIAHPLISRAHLVLRFDQGRWVGIDNGSLNGLYVNGRRVPAVDIADGQQVNIGSPDGPGLTFEVGRHQGSAGTPPQTTSVPLASRPSPAYPSQPPHHRLRRARISSLRPPPTRSSRCIRPDRSRDTRRVQPAYPSGPSSYSPSTSQPVRPTAVAQPISSPGLESVTQMGPTAAPRTSEGNLATSMLKILRPGRAAEVPAGAIKIGRATDNDIVIPDVLASRHHATLVPTPGGAEIIDNRSINGTFVNGARVESAMLHDGDTVTIGNVDLRVPRRHAGPPHRDRGRDPHRRPRGARRHVDHRGQQDAAGQHLDGRAPRHADGGHRAVGCGQVDVRTVGGRLHPSDDGHGVVRRTRRPRRVRLTALPNRDGAAGRRRARPAHRQAGADVRGRTAAAARYQQGRPRTGRQRRCSRNSR